MFVKIQRLDPTRRRIWYDMANVPATLRSAPSPSITNARHHISRQSFVNFLAYSKTPNSLTKDRPQWGRWRMPQAFLIPFQTPNPITEKHMLGPELGLWKIPRRSISSPFKAQMEDSGKTKKLSEMDTKSKRVLQIALWTMEGVYIWWLFLLPYAPGDPVWAIKPDTIKILLDLSLNFFYFLPLLNLAGFHLMEAPVLHPTVEALFNFVIGWTMMFAPLLFTDHKRDRFGSSLEALWVVQMFLTNTLLIPYMAIRLGDKSNSSSLKSQNGKSGFQSVITSGALNVAIVGGLVGVVSVLWALFGRANAGFGSLADRWDFFLNYLGCDRPGYAFIWDICLYSIFQPWLIGDNLENVDEQHIQTVRYLRFVPYLGLVAYLWALAKNED